MGELPLGPDHIRAEPARRRRRVPTHDGRHVGPRRPRGGAARVPGPGGTGHPLGLRREPSRQPHGHAPAPARVLRRLPRAGGRLRPPLAHGAGRRRAVGRLPVPRARRRRGRSVPRPPRAHAGRRPARDRTGAVRPRARRHRGVRAPRRRQRRVASLTSRLAGSGRGPRVRLPRPVAPRPDRPRRRHPHRLPGAARPPTPAVSVVVGLDVADGRGCDAVLLGGSMVARPLGKVMSGGEFEQLLTEVDPVAVAIDSPPRWTAPGRRRECESELTKRSISLFSTPDEERGTANSFYAWMRVGFEMFWAARRYPTLETFPYAAAVVIDGHRRAGTKRQVRLRALASVGVVTRELRTIDQIDAALCAYTAWEWKFGTHVNVGNEGEGQITLPAAALLDSYAREPVSTR